MLELYLMFALGLVGSLHCTQMCGPLVLAFSLPLAAESRWRRALAQLSYNGGRIATYSALGGVAGFFGSAITRISGLESAAALLGGVLMIAAGLLMTGFFKPSQLVQLGASAPFTQRISRLLISPAAGTKFTMGLLLGFLPCGMIYAALLKSIASGDPLSGAMAMCAFGLGTALPLLALGLFAATIGRWLGRWSTQLAAVSVTLMGAFLVWRGLLPTAVHPHCH